MTHTLVIHGSHSRGAVPSTYLMNRYLSLSRSIYHLKQINNRVKVARTNVSFAID